MQVYWKKIEILFKIKICEQHNKMSLEIKINELKGQIKRMLERIKDEAVMTRDDALTLQMKLSAYESTLRLQKQVQDLVLNEVKQDDVKLELMRELRENYKVIRECYRNVSFRYVPELAKRKIDMIENLVKQEDQVIRFLQKEKKQAQQ